MKSIDKERLKRKKRNRKLQVDSIVNNNKERLKKQNKASLLMLLLGVVLLVIAILWGLAGIRYHWWTIFVLPAMLPLYGGLWLTFISIKEFIFGGNKKTLVSNIEYENNKIKESKIEEKKRQKYLNELNNLKNKYGSITKQILYNNYSEGNYYGKSKINDTIYVFESSSILIIEGNPYPFKYIISFEVMDNSNITYSSQSATTKSSTGSIIGRAAVGGLLFGGAGAIIGGATAKKETEISSQNSHTTHDYTIAITVNSLSNSLIKLHIGSEVKIVQEISSILSIIIERNNHQ